MHRRGRPGVLTPRPQAPANLAHAPVRCPVGEDRRAGRAARPRRDREHVHPRTNGRDRTRLPRVASRGGRPSFFPAQMRKDGRIRTPEGGVVMKRRTVVIGAALAPHRSVRQHRRCVRDAGLGSGRTCTQPADGRQRDRADRPGDSEDRHYHADRAGEDEAGNGQSSRQDPGARDAAAYHLRRDGLRHRVPGAHHPPRRLHRVAHPPRADVRRGIQWRRVDVPGRRNRVHAHQVRGGFRVLAALDRGSQHAKRGHNAARLARVLLPAKAGRTTRLSGSTKRSRRTARTSRRSARDGRRLFAAPVSTASCRRTRPATEQSDSAKLGRISSSGATPRATPKLETPRLQRCSIPGGPIRTLGVLPRDVVDAADG